MPNVLTITCENPDEILNAGAYGAGAVVRVQTSATEAGIFADVTGTGSTPTIAIVTAVRAYTGYDPAGIVSSWYRTRYENVGATRVSDWTPAFQVGDEMAGMLCSIYDVSQRLFGTATVSTSNTEILLEIIRNVSNEMEDFCGRWLAPRPTNPASDMTLRFDVPYTGRSLTLVRGGLYTGIRRLTSINLASGSQPETAGTYTAGTAADFLIRPQSVDGTAGTGLEVLWPSSSAFFYAGYNTVEVTGGFGPAVVAGWCQEVAIAKVTRRFIGKESATTATPIGPDGDVIFAGLPRDLADALLRHRYLPVG